MIAKVNDTLGKESGYDKKEDVEKMENVVFSVYSKKTLKEEVLKMVKKSYKAKDLIQVLSVQSKLEKAFDKEVKALFSKYVVVQ